MPKHIHYLGTLKFFLRQYITLWLVYYGSLDISSYKYSLQREKYGSVGHVVDRSVHSLQNRFSFAPLLYHGR